MGHITNIISAYKGSMSMDQLSQKINQAAGRQVMPKTTLYSYTTRGQRPDPKQAGILARYMARNSQERAEILKAYIEDTLDATDIPPSERGLEILIAVSHAITEAVGEDQATYSSDRPDRDRDLDRLRDAWHTDHDLRELIHNLANLTGNIGSTKKSQSTMPGTRLPTNGDTISDQSTGA